MDTDSVLSYGRLPNNKIMINWPINGNDYYINAINSPPLERARLYEKAKWYTQCYIFYLQNKNDPDKKEPITRKALAIILDLIADPFSVDVDHYGTFIYPTKLFWGPLGHF